MLITHSEEIDSHFQGTIVDIETIGDFCQDYSDSRYYQNITPTIFGYVNGERLNIFCAKGIDAIEELKEETIQRLPYLEKPLFAFNCRFEKGVLFNSCEIEIDFEGELNEESFESKKSAIGVLGIPNYGDPFHDSGLECMKAWINGDYRRAIKHNRSCLLKERDILLKRGYRKPGKLTMYSP